MALRICKVSHKLIIKMPITHEELKNSCHYHFVLFIVATTTV